jgi:putative FmdB family regulatory protein
MPIYGFICYDDETEVEELRKLGDDKPPKCPNCGVEMSRLFSPVVNIFQGKSNAEKVSAKLKKRSEEQGKKFFKRHPEFQKMVSETLKDKGKEN